MLEVFDTFPIGNDELNNFQEDIPTYQFSIEEFWQTESLSTAAMPISFYSSESRVLNPLELDDLIAAQTTCTEFLRYLTESVESPLLAQLDDLEEQKPVVTSSDEVESEEGDKYEELSELDLNSFLSENMPDFVEKAEKTSTPDLLSNDKRLAQDEDKAAITPKEKSTAPEENISFTPAFKAATKRENQRITRTLPERESRTNARKKILEAAANPRPKAKKYIPKKKCKK